MSDINAPDSDSDQDSDSDVDGAAQNNAKAGKNTSKKIVGAGGAEDEDNNLGKSKIQIKIEQSMEVNNLVLSLSNMRLQNLGDLQKMTTLSNLQKVDISKNYLDNIDVLNSLKRLKVIVASDNYIRAVNL